MKVIIKPVGKEPSQILIPNDLHVLQQTAVRSCTERSRQMLYMGICNLKNLCVDCKSEICGHAGDIGADCPKWTCDMPNYSCEECPWIKEYVEKVRKEQNDE